MESAAISIGTATKVTQVFQRPNGSEAKIVVETMYGAGLHRSVNVIVFSRAQPGQNWELRNDRPAEGWRQMPREQYIKHGRSEALQTVTPGEILKVTALLGQPMSRFANSAQV